MNRTIETRVAKLEERAGARQKQRQPVHSLIAESEEEKAEKIAALIASGKAKESDLFIVNMIVDPEPNLRRLGVLL